ncbi:keratin-associated protein 26-1-like [Ictidomys tridecemlineatus]
MSCHNACSGNYSSGCLRNSCHVPLNAPVALCSTNVSCGDVLCVPGVCQNQSWFPGNCQETSGELNSCQPANCETSSCSSTAYYVPRPCQGSGFLPTSSFLSSSCLPVSYRPLSYVSSHCRPTTPLVTSFQPTGCVSSGYRPLTCLPNSGRPLNLLPYGYRPTGCVTYNPQAGNIVSSSFRPLQPHSSSCQTLPHVFSTCRPSCSAQGGL